MKKSEFIQILGLLLFKDQDSEAIRQLKSILKHPQVINLRRAFFRVFATSNKEGFESVRQGVMKRIKYRYSFLASASRIFAKTTFTPFGPSK